MNDMTDWGRSKPEPVKEFKQPEPTETPSFPDFVLDMTRMMEELSCMVSCPGPWTDNYEFSKTKDEMKCICTYDNNYSTIWKRGKP